VPRGGHNILEPAQFAKPILVGPHTENFRDIISIFRRGQALVEVKSEDLLAELTSLLTSPEHRQQLGGNALKVFESQRGATARTIDALEVLLWMPESIAERYREVRR